MPTLQEALKNAKVKEAVGNSVKDWDRTQGIHAKEIMGSGDSKKENCVAIPWKLYFKAKARKWICSEDDKKIVKIHGVGSAFCPVEVAERLLEKFKDLMKDLNVSSSLFGWQKFKGYKSLWISDEVFNYEDCIPQLDFISEEF